MKITKKHIIFHGIVTIFSLIIFIFGLFLNISEFKFKILLEFSILLFLSSIYWLKRANCIVTNIELLLRCTIPVVFTAILILIPPYYGVRSAYWQIFFCGLVYLYILFGNLLSTPKLHLKEVSFLHLALFLLCMLLTLCFLDFGYRAAWQPGENYWITFGCFFVVPALAGFFGIFPNFYFKTGGNGYYFIAACLLVLVGGLSLLGVYKEAEMLSVSAYFSLAIGVLVDYKRIMTTKGS